MFLGYFDRRFTKKGQKEKEGSTNTIILKKEKGKEEGRSLNNILIITEYII